MTKAMSWQMRAASARYQHQNKMASRICRLSGQHHHESSRKDTANRITTVPSMTPEKGTTYLCMTNFCTPEVGACTLRCCTLRELTVETGKQCVREGERPPTTAFASTRVKADDDETDERNDDAQHAQHLTRSPPTCNEHVIWACDVTKDNCEILKLRRIHVMKVANVMEYLPCWSKH